MHSQNVFFYICLETLDFGICFVDELRQEQAMHVVYSSYELGTVSVFPFPSIKIQHWSETVPRYQLIPVCQPMN